MHCVTPKAGGFSAFKITALLRFTLILCEITVARRVIPPGRVLVGLEADLVVVVDQFWAFALGRLGAAEEVDLLGDDLAAVAVDTRRIGPLRVVDAALDQELHALLAVLGDRLAEAVEAGDAVPFGVHHAVAVLVADRATFREAGARGGEGEVGDLRAALGRAGFRGLTDVAGEDDDVLHGV